MPRRSAAQVEGDRDQTLRAAVDVASVVGLEGLTIGRLAERLGMSKSGLVGRFGSKEQLQLATLERAAAMFREAVYEPAVTAAPGRARLLAICESWIDHLGSSCFPGGCFLTTASVEFDGREGPVRDAVELTLGRWLRVLEAEAAVAVAAGELARDTDPAQVAFTLNALAMGTNCAYQLNRRASALERGRRAMLSVLD
ncbi:MAG TPA: helix-turn-helix domain-containing protein [Solirubrobacteraceae bacterium]|nr:helix-turn-helix domain-containing protein [Solirubrobacteraceae bacterium]